MVVGPLVDLVVLRPEADLQQVTAAAAGADLQQVTAAEHRQVHLPEASQEASFFLLPKLD